MNRAGWRFVSCVVIAWCAASSTYAQEPETEREAEAYRESRQRFEIARLAFEQGDYATALLEWERVYAMLEGHPNREYVTFNMARANEELGRYREALELYERYLERTADRADAPNRVDAGRNAQELRLRLRLAEDGEPPDVETDPHEEGTSDTGGGFEPSVVGIVIGSVGAAALIAGAVVGGLALAQHDDALASCEGTRCTPQGYAALGDAGALANVADGLLWGGLGVLATGVVLTFVLGESGTGASAACTDDGCAAFVAGVF